MDDSDVPPLEDMSELIQKLEALKELKGIKSSNTAEGKQQSNINQASKPPTSSSNTSSKSSTSSASKSSSSSSSAQKENKPQNTGFGGFKKGFMFGGPAKKSSSTTKKDNDSQSKTPPTDQKDDIPFISAPSGDKNENLSLPEVQNAMGDSANALKDKADWVTNDLLEKVQKNKDLVQKLQDPKYVNVINEFQANPQAAMQKYQSSPEIQQFFTDFCGILGTHFENLADKEDPGKADKPKSKVQEVHTKDPQGGADLSVRSSTNPNQATAEDEHKMQEILSNPEIRDVLMDPKIQNLFQMLRTDPEKGHRFMMNADDDMKMKIRRLVDCGLLQFQS